MNNMDLIVSNLMSPAVICFAIGAFASLIKSDLRVPGQVHEGISMYLLFAIGLKGGLALSQTAFLVVFYPILATLALGVATPVISYFLAYKIGKMDRLNSAALAAHFGSVSAVTFMAALNFAQNASIVHEGFMTALVVVLEIPGIIVAIALAGLFAKNEKVNFKKVIHDAMTGKSVILLAGGAIVGLFADKSSLASISNVFISPFQGMLVFFLLEMGVVAASKLKEIKSLWLFMLIFGTVTPLLFACLGIFAGSLAGLSYGGAAILGVMAASASYIAAPAAVKMALPNANPAIYLTLSISITLPFNISIGIPLYFSMAKMFAF